MSELVPVRVEVVFEEVSVPGLTSPAVTTPDEGPPSADGRKAGASTMVTLPGGAALVARGAAETGAAPLANGSSVSSSSRWTSSISVSSDARMALLGADGAIELWQLNASSPVHPAAFEIAESTFDQYESSSHRAAAWIAKGDLAARRGDDTEAARLYRRAAETLQDFRF